tara:strand:- start:22 stop:1167 length:1146 start_codon:yes stop_codon:yes gene_type:complete
MSSHLKGYLPRAQLQQLLDHVIAHGYEVHGPRIQDGAVVYLPLHSTAQLPSGVRDLQAPGRYRMESTGGDRHFSWANGPQALKPLLFAPHETLWQARRETDGQIEFILPPSVNHKRAVLGVRACDLAALRLQDQHFMEGEYIDPYYSERRRELLLISVNCSHPAETCFCASTGDGPVVSSGFDINLTELDQGYVVESGTERGEALLLELSLSPVTQAHEQACFQQANAATDAQTRTLPTIRLHDLLEKRADHPQWDDIAERCLACGNCTQVCPTCFCHREGDLASLDGSESSHHREWDSCFTAGHGYLAGFQVRPDTKSRYRQWMTHKLDSWQAQFGRSGCVGCGRCTSWCPAEIDFAAEAHALMTEPAVVGTWQKENDDD